MEFSFNFDHSKFSEAFNKIPLLAAKELRLELKPACQSIVTYAKANHRFDSKSNALENGINYTVDATGLHADVQLNKDGRAPYALYQHEGTKDHFVSPSKKKSLYWASGGNKRFSKGHNVSGIKKDQFLYKAAQKKEPEVLSRINRAINRVIEMAGF